MEKEKGFLFIQRTLISFCSFYSIIAFIEFQKRIFSLYNKHEIFAVMTESNTTSCLFLNRRFGANSPQCKDTIIHRNRDVIWTKNDKFKNRGYF